MTGSWETKIAILVDLKYLIFTEVSLLTNESVASVLLETEKDLGVWFH